MANLWFSPPIKQHFHNLVTTSILVSKKRHVCIILNLPYWKVRSNITKLNNVNQTIYSEPLMWSTLDSVTKVSGDYVIGILLSKSESHFKRSDSNSKWINSHSKQIESHSKKFDSNSKQSDSNFIWSNSHSKRPDNQKDNQ